MLAAHIRGCTQLQPPHAENYLTPLPPMTPRQHERKLFNRVSSSPPYFFSLSLSSPPLETDHPLTTFSREIVARASEFYRIRELIRSPLPRYDSFAP